MAAEIFRPWGLLGWLLGKLAIRQWSLLGCLSPEPRCLATLEIMTRKRRKGLQQFFAVTDPPSRYSQLAAGKMTERRQEFLKLGGTANEIEDHELFERTENLVVAARRFISEAGEDIIFDLTSFPKRFFLPILRLLLEAHTIRNLITTYTLPEQYCDQPLAEDPEPWRHVPLYAPQFPEPKVNLLIAAIGFETLGLPELLQHDYHDVHSKFIFPFPPGPPAFQRTWNFMRKIEAGGPEKRREPIRVPALDTSEAFDHILALTDRGKQYAILAPYGPKPLSVAMGIYALLAHAPLYYTQPRIYNPEYSSGIRRLGDEPETYAYCLRLGGNPLYSLNAV